MVTLKVGDKAPTFSLQGSDGKKYSLKDFKGKNIVLYFYPKDSTPGCTKEACSFRDHLGEIKKKGAVVIGMSADTIESHQIFVNKYDLNFILLSDTDKKILESYGVWKKKSMYGIHYMGIERTTLIIDEKGIITHIFPKVKVNGHSEEIIAALS
jgi:thioredoxin-dependent peroxiredoxin